MTSPQAPRLHALVPCAGVGTRANVGGPKQYAALCGRSVVGHTLAALGGVARLTQIVVVLSPDDMQFEAAVPGFAGSVFRCGGETRAQTVANGLAELARRGAAGDDWVLVHDAARCLVRPEWIAALIDACEGDEVGGLLALPLADTLKQSRVGRAITTLSRTDKWQAQTPQMFRLGMLREALARAGSDVTDEASAIEAMGHLPKLVPGSLENFKLTYASDFELAERLLRTRE
jgi:2-C-methyl-D-erythritol 4-phosphate cytidylyltransferase